VGAGSSRPELGFAPGTQVGPYLILDELGRGGMGVVYLAEDQRLGRRIALKSVPPAAANDPTVRERLRREARAAATISHPAVATVFSLDEIDGHLLNPAVERVTTLLTAARESVPALRRGLPPSTPQSWTASPELFARLPEFGAAATALQRLGGDLTAADLAQTGVAGLLGSDVQFDVQGVGTDLACYGARGDVERLDLVGLNACRPVPVAGWELIRLGRSGIDGLMPVPAAARFMPRPGWNLTAAAATWWLRRSTGREARCTGLSRILDLGRRLQDQQL